MKIITFCNLTGSFSYQIFAFVYKILILHNFVGKEQTMPRVLSGTCDRPEKQRRNCQLSLNPIHSLRVFVLGTQRGKGGYDLDA